MCGFDKQQGAYFYSNLPSSIEQFHSSMHKLCDFLNDPFIKTTFKDRYAERLEKMCPYGIQTRRVNPNTPALPPKRA